MPRCHNGIWDSATCAIRISIKSLQISCVLFAPSVSVLLCQLLLPVNIESVRNLKITLFISNSITAICDAIYCISKEVKETDQGQYVSFLRPPVPRVNLQADLIADVLYALITKD